MADGSGLTVREEPHAGGSAAGQAETPSREALSVEKPQETRAFQNPAQNAPAGPAAAGKAEHKHHGHKHHDKGETKKKSRIRKPLLAAAALIALAAGGYEGYHWWTLGRFEIETDDAYVHVDITILAAKVSGYITSVDVTDNQFVREGDIVARIDDGDYRLAVDAAKGKVATQQAAIARITEQIKAGQASVEQAEAQIDAAQADVDRAELEFDRQQQLEDAVQNARAQLEEAYRLRASVTP